MQKVTAKFPSLKVLLVEDYFINQEVTIDMLEMLGCQVDVAEDGLQAVKMAEENSYDLIIMDLQLPGIDGMEATKRIRTNERPEAKSVIIALTANALEGDKENCMKIGMNDYISKPMEITTLEEKIRKFFPQKMVVAS